MSKLKEEERFPILNTYGWFIVIINLAFFIVNTIALCINFPRAKNFGFDYLGVIVGILAILVTVLIGWQIFINLSFEKKIDEKINNVSKQIKEEIDAKFMKVSEDINDTRDAALAASLYQLAFSEFLAKRHTSSLWLSLDAIVHCSKIKSMDNAFKDDVFTPLVKFTSKNLNNISNISLFNEQRMDLYIKSCYEIGLLEIAYLIKNKHKPNSSSQQKSYLDYCIKEVVRLQNDIKVESKININPIENG